MEIFKVTSIKSDQIEFSSDNGNRITLSQSCDVANSGFLDKFNILQVVGIDITLSKESTAYQLVNATDIINSVEFGYEEFENNKGNGSSASLVLTKNTELFNQCYNNRSIDINISILSSNQPSQKVSNDIVSDIAKIISANADMMNKGNSPKE